MSVDPDDRTPGAIKDTGADIVTYGAPVLPGAMLLLAYYHKDGKTIPVIGLPGCVMYARRTVFDLILPRIMADDPICAEEICAYGEGGLCHCGELRPAPRSDGVTAGLRIRQINFLTEDIHENIQNKHI